MTPLAAEVSGLLAGVAGYRGAWTPSTTRNTAAQAAPAAPWPGSSHRSRTGRRPLTRGRSPGGCSRASPDASSRTVRPFSSAPSRTGPTGSAAGAAYGIRSRYRCPPRTGLRRTLGRRGVRRRLHRPADCRALPADLGVRRHDRGLGPRRPPRLRRGHRNRVLAADQTRLDHGLRRIMQGAGP